MAARTAPLSEPFIDASAPAFKPLSAVSEIPVASAAARAEVPSQSYMPQGLKDARQDRACRRPYIPVSAYAIPLRLPDFAVPGIIQPELEDSMVAASVAPPSFEQCRDSANHLGVLSKILVKMMTKDMFGPVAQFGRHLLEKSNLGSSPFCNEASEEMIMNDRPTTRNVGGQEMPAFGSLRRFQGGFRRFTSPRLIMTMRSGRSPTR